MDILEAHDAGSAGGDYGDVDDKDEMFADNSERQKLEIDVSVDAVTANASPVHTQKWRQSSMSHGSHGKQHKVLSITNLLKIWNQLAKNQQKLDLA